MRRSVPHCSRQVKNGPEKHLTCRAAFTLLFQNCKSNDYAMCKTSVCWHIRNMEEGGIELRRVYYQIYRASLALTCKHYCYANCNIDQHCGTWLVAIVACDGANLSIINHIKWYRWFENEGNWGIKRNENVTYIHAQWHHLILTTVCMTCAALLYAYSTGSTIVLFAIFWCKFEWLRASFYISFSEFLKPTCSTHKCWQCHVSDIR